MGRSLQGVVMRRARIAVGALFACAPPTLGALSSKQRPVKPTLVSDNARCGTFGRSGFWPAPVKGLSQIYQANDAVKKQPLHLQQGDGETKPLARGVKRQAADVTNPATQGVRKWKLDAGGAQPLARPLEMQAIVRKTTSTGIC